VTNSVGDELAMDDKCALEYTPAEPTPSESPSPTAASVSSSSTRSAAVSLRGTIGSVWQLTVVVASFLVPLLFC
jgi:hypothetical protein